MKITVAMPLSPSQEGKEFKMTIKKGSNEYYYIEWSASRIIEDNFYCEKIDSKCYEALDHLIIINSEGFDLPLEFDQISADKRAEKIFTAAQAVAVEVEQTYPEMVHT